MKKILSVLFLFISSQAGAVPFSTGDVVNIGWSFDTGSGLLEAESTWTVASYSSSEILIDISITNTTSSADFVNAGILSFGFDVEPDATGTLETPGSVFDTIANSVNFPSFQTIDICLFAQNCAGGSQNAGLAIGDNDTLRIALAGTFGNSVDLTTFPIKFQTNIGSYEFGGTDCVDCSTSVPEPGMIALLGISLLSLVGIRRRMKV